MKKLLIPLVIAPLFAALPAMAENGHWGGHAAYYERHSEPVTLNYDTRLARQREAIERGIARGAITWHEAERLFQEQARIARYKRIATADGYFTTAERARVSHLLDASAHHIRQATRNSDYGYDRPYGRYDQYYDHYDRQYGRYDQYYGHYDRRIGD